jgi:hypothetical protein
MKICTGNEESDPEIQRLKQKAKIVERAQISVLEAFEDPPKSVRGSVSSFFFLF